MCSIQAGKYQVWVNMYNNCDPSIPTNWVITALHEGALVSPSFGQNPSHGVFPINAKSNKIDYSFTGATKVMEFTLTNVQHSSSAPFRKASAPLTESAKAKLIKANENIEK